METIRDLAVRVHSGLYVDKKRLADGILVLLELVDELERRCEVRRAGCQCSDDDACWFARERDEARADADRLAGALKDVRDLIRHQELRAAEANAWSHGHRYSNEFGELAERVNREMDAALELHESRFNDAESEAQEEG